MENRSVEVIVLGCSEYSFKDKETQRDVTGCNVWFIQKTPENSSYGVGFLPKKATLPHEMYKEYASLSFPYLCEVKMDTFFTGKGAVTKIVGFNPITKAEFDQ